MGNVPYAGAEWLVLEPESVAMRKVGEGMGLLDRDAFQWMELLRFGDKK